MVGKIGTGILYIFTAGLLVFGIIYCITIVGAVIGIFMIIAYTKGKEIYEKEESLAIADLNNNVYFYWAIFILIVEFSLGLFIFLPYILKK